MKTTADVYHPLKVEKIRRKLEQAAATGRPEYYCVLVDELEVIPVTNDPAQLLNYHGFVDGMTKEVSIMLYGMSPENSPINYVFYMQEKSPTATPLQGVDFEKKLDEKLMLEKERWQTMQLKEKYEDVQKQLAEAEEYIGMLQERLEENKKAMSEKGFDLGSIGQVIKENPEILSIFSGKKDLSGTLANTGKTKEEGQQEQSSFKRKGSQADHQERGENIESMFTAEEQTAVQEIVLSLAKNKAGIARVAEFLKNNPKNQTKEETKDGNV